MNKIIKGFGKFPENMQEDIYACFQEGELRRANFPYQGEMAEGVIYDDEESDSVFLIPISTIKASKFSTADDDDDDDSESDDVDLDNDELEDEE